MHSAQAKYQAQMIAPTANRPRPLVLHVDDDAASLIMAESSLEEAGFDVVHAENGEKALLQFKAHEPDLIIMDAVMPVMDGFEAINHIRRNAMGAHVPILMITGLDDLDSITRAYNEGATDFLTKPINFFVLPHRIQYMLRSKRTADALRSSQAKLDNAQRIARLGHWDWSVDTNELTWSSEFGRTMGFPSNMLKGTWTGFLEKLSDDQRHSVRMAATQAVEEARGFSVEFTLINSAAEDQDRTIRLEAEPHLNEQGKCTHLLGTMQDITERTNAQRQIHNLAYFDLVTGLPNRAQLNEQLNYALKMAKRRESKFALLFLDLDHFKQVNDTLGHDAGDELLQQVSGRLTDVVRDSDSVAVASEPDDEDDITKHTVARLGGDEFVVLLGSINRVEDAARVAERIAKSISAPYTLNDTEVSVTTTIGISVFPADGRSAEMLMKHADVAMYHAKEKGRNGYQFYSRGIHEQALARFSMESELKKAIDNGDLKLAYQPKIDAVSGEAIGVEALLRWEHPESGMISPAEFIPLAEETGLILPMGRWVLQQACRQMKDWIDDGMEPITMAVNCSPAQFIRGNMIKDIDAAISQSGLPSGLLEVELTESLFLQDIENGINILQSMKRIGIQISIDDFGTGFSSLSYLKRLPIDKLKIDQSFVHDLGRDPGDGAIVSAIIALSHNLNLTVVAEGVETAEQLDILRGYDCDEYQGYLISEPLYADEFLSWFESHRPSPLRKAG
jgi:predicted signal transduction protein with EAL and GGDEF domain/DNA-binding response OmpR family regulator